tara:strand:- start:124 stop:360 length:237 start_codon:yes stop_codon:yes gene_type:complete
MAADILKKTLDPDNDLTHRKVDDGNDIVCEYKGGKVSYDDYLNIHEERGERLQRGESLKPIRLFGGVGEGTLKKSYED